MPPLVNHTSNSKNKKKTEEPFSELDEHAVPFWISFTTYLGYGVLMMMGYIREFWRQFFPAKSRATPEGYAPLLRDFDDFYTRRLYTRIRDAWNRPINTRPGRVIGVMERVSNDYNISFKFSGKTLPCINLSSYNYLGFAENPPYVHNAVKESIAKFGVSSCSAPSEFGNHAQLQELEELTARFVGKEAACVFCMGFATNSTSMSILLGRGALIISDNLNHSSIVSGARGSAASIQVFPHKKYDKLEQLVRKAIWSGQPRTHRPWKQIMIVIEGVYSMEGEVVDLKEVVRIKKKYGVSLFVDEAHSIGALGKTGRGVCEHCGVDVNDVDVLMGTFTKSFGSIGGYIAANKDIIRSLKENSGGRVGASSLPPACASQALHALKVIMGEDGTTLGRDALRSIADNSKWFRSQLLDLGLTVYGDVASPVIPVLLYNPAKMPAFSRECLKRGLAVVVVGYPATPLIESRVRFCISAAHTREDLQRAIDIVREVRDYVMIKYQSKNES